MRPSEDLVAILLELPVAVIQGANLLKKVASIHQYYKAGDLACLEPAGDAVEVEGMIAPARVKEIYFRGKNNPMNRIILFRGGWCVTRL